jgi:Asp-tRNA(Asn)/Glu-tRNA(Gln) amidotransferase A subunit family amidase
MIEKGIDLWISPAAPGVAPKGLHSTGDPVMNLPWTHCGFPSLSLPSGKNDDGLPYGLQLVGKWDGDEQLLFWSMQIETTLSQSLLA